MHELFPAAPTFGWVLAAVVLVVGSFAGIGIGIGLGFVLSEVIAVKCGLDYGVEDFGTDEQRIKLLARQIRVNVVAIQEASPRLADDAPHIFRAYHDRLFRLNKQRYEEGLTGCYVLDAHGQLSLVGDYTTYRRSDLEGVGYDFSYDNN